MIQDVEEKIQKLREEAVYFQQKIKMKRQEIDQQYSFKNKPGVYFVGTAKRLQPEL